MRFEMIVVKYDLSAISRQKIFLAKRAVFADAGL
jgi:hypothetical protein